MDVEQIIKAVRWCYDEEAHNTASFSSASADDNTLMNNIIKSKIGDALRWICLYAPAEILDGSDEVSLETGILVDAELSDHTTSDNGVGIIEGAECLVMTMPPSFIKLARVREVNWHRAIITPIAEDSEEYLQLHDPNGATATVERPQAAIRNKSTRQIELWPLPEGDSFHVEVTFVADPGNSYDTSSPSTKVAIPPKGKTAFIYYLAYLTLSAYEDSRAARMLEIAKMNIGRNG